MAGLEKLGKLVYLEDDKGSVGSCELQMQDKNGDGLIRDPHNQTLIALENLDSSDVLECNPNGDQANAFSEGLADVALKRMGIHAFPQNPLLQKKLQTYTDRINSRQQAPGIPTSGLRNYVGHMSQADNLSRAHLGDKSIPEIKANLKNIEDHLAQAENSAGAVNVNFSERTQFEDAVRKRAYTGAAQEIGKRAIVIANEAVALGNPQGAKVDEAIQLLREYQDQARNANLGVNEISKVEDLVVKLLSILRVDGPI